MKRGRSRVVLEFSVRQILQTSANHTTCTLRNEMSSAVVLAGLGLAAIGIGGRYLMRYSKNMAQTFNTSALFEATSKYHKGGFEPKMSRREASLVLGVSQTANAAKIRDAHRRVMLANHPDRGGSPYVAAKINEAKDVMESQLPK